MSDTEMKLESSEVPGTEMKLENSKCLSLKCR